MKLIVLQGVPASGKSTWAREFVKGKKNWVIINMDSLRNMRGDYWIPEQESFISQIEYNIAIEATINKLNIIVDATNLNPKTIDKWTQFAVNNDYDIEFKFFDISVDEAIKRDSLRSNPVGKDVIKYFFKKYIPCYSKVNYCEQDEKLTPCLIIDLDDTVALNYHRKMYDETKYQYDSPNIPIINLIERLYLSYDKKLRLVFLTGREDIGKARENTVKWIIKYFGNERIFKLLMRNKGDKRSGNIVKKELYEEFVKPFFNVQYVLEDSVSQANMWREQGLCCLQVNNNNY